MAVVCAYHNCSLFTHVSIHGKIQIKIDYRGTAVSFRVYVAKVLEFLARMRRPKGTNANRAGTKKITTKCCEHFPNEMYTAN